MAVLRRCNHFIRVGESAEAQAKPQRRNAKSGMACKVPLLYWLPRKTRAVENGHSEDSELPSCKNQIMCRNQR